MWSLFAVPFGIAALFVGIGAWRDPLPAFIRRWMIDIYPLEADADSFSRFFGKTRERAEKSILVARLIAPLVGSVFVVVGLWLAASEVHCGAVLPNLSGIIGPLAWSPWPGMWVFVVFAVAMTAWGTRGERWYVRIAAIVFVTAWSICGGQAAGFHTGVYAKRWFVLCGLLTAAVLLVSLVYYRLNRGSRTG
jgi:hypothetical protein